MPNNSIISFNTKFHVNRMKKLIIFYDWLALVGRTGRPKIMFTMAVGRNSWIQQPIAKAGKLPAATY